MAPRKPTADNAKAAAATSPVMVGFSSAKLFSPPDLSAVMTTPIVAMTIASTFSRQVVAEEDEAEDRGLDRLGLQIRRRHHEGTVVHREQHQAGGDDLAERTQQQPRPEHGGRRAEMIAGRDQHHAQKQ